MRNHNPLTFELIDVQLTFMKKQKWVAVQGTNSKDALEPLSEMGMDTVLMKVWQGIGHMVHSRECLQEDDTKEKEPTVQLAKLETLLALIHSLEFTATYERPSSLHSSINRSFASEHMAIYIPELPKYCDRKVDNSNT